MIILCCLGKVDYNKTLVGGWHITDNIIKRFINKGIAKEEKSSSVITRSYSTPQIPHYLPVWTSMMWDVLLNTISDPPSSLKVCFVRYHV